jgi:molybdate transport system regulatory protein
MTKDIKPVLKIWFERKGEYAFGGGIAKILEAIHKTGSITKAAISLEESYRYAWGRIQKTEEIMGVKLVKTTIGGQDKARASLTEFALKILYPYMRFESTVRKQTENAYRKMMRDINK